MNFNQRFHKKYNNVEVKSFYRKEKLFWVRNGDLNFRSNIKRYYFEWFAHGATDRFDFLVYLV
ncbi:hypothetical protein LEP1GSC082_4294 [Leptospira kirschneri str. H2]|uniref:Uncharacterized protein n=1 Tax=Leptospira kirschneri str. H1 TaxID=1049966 RepID=A0A0E2AYU4_9LEPT|nr:hypothetical protein LEP1GSC081_2513 [Leptospira kirschneri str. H1]EKO62368.1 hypothetical protein LEP1GSC082_4294 [Leptospira kirschneri str. H2]